MASYLLITREQTMQKQTHFTSYAITEKNHWLVIIQAWKRFEAIVNVYRIFHPGTTGLWESVEKTNKRMADIDLEALGLSEFSYPISTATL